MLTRWWGLLAAFLFLGGCRAPGNITADNYSKSDLPERNYRLIYIIHGDASYLYHDREGQPVQSDEQQFQEAVKVARKARHGEVFVYHQKPETKILWIFPRKDRLMAHFRNGRRIHREKYSPTSDGKAFSREEQLFHRYRTQDSERTFFLYYGHEIPQDSTLSYFQSRPDAKLSTDNFVAGESSFLADSSTFELTVLSTCENGSPSMVKKQQPLTKYLLASQQDLHLSQIDSEKLLLLEENPDITTKKLSKAIAMDSFNRLSTFLQTAVTLSIYDMERVGNYIDSLSVKDSNAVKDTNGGIVEQGKTDCANLPFWNAYQPSDGVITFFKPAKFGDQANKEEHSGWGC